MLEIQRIRLNKNQLAEKLLDIRKADFSKELNEAFRIDELKRNTQQKLDDNKSSLNKLSAEIGKLFKEGNHKLANEIKSETGVLKEKIKKPLLQSSKPSTVTPVKVKSKNNLPDFDIVIEGYDELPGLFNLYWNKEKNKFLIAIHPNQLEKTYLANLTDIVDVSGALETNKVKDINKIKKFIDEVKKINYEN